MNANPAIDNRITDIINSAYKYRYIKRVGIFGSYKENAVNVVTETNSLNLIYDYDGVNIDSKDELLEYIEDVDMLARHILGVSKTDFICYTDAPESEDDIIWIYNRDSRRL